MLSKNQVQQASDPQLEIKLLKQENQRLKDTIALLKEEYRRERSEREMYALLHNKAEVEIQMLKKALSELEQSRREAGNTTSRAYPKPPLPSSKLTNTQVSLDQSTIVACTMARSILKKKSSNLSNFDHYGKEQDINQGSSGALRTLKDIRLGGSNSTSSLHRAENSSQKNVQFSGAQKEDSTGRLSERRRTYFDKISQG